MKNTLLILMLAAACSVPAFASTPGIPGKVSPSTGTSCHAGTETITSGTMLGNGMIFGYLTNGSIPGGSLPTGGNFYASSYTLSMWLDVSSLLGSDDITLFGYYGNSSNGAYGCNALVLKENKTIAMGDGRLDAGTGVFTQDRGAASATSIFDASLGSGLLNITLSVDGQNGTQAASIYVNGEFLSTLSYNGNMNGGNDSQSMANWLNSNLVWGDVSWTNSALGADDISVFAGLQVPEPTTASLGLLSLAALMMRRRRS